MKWNFHKKSWKCRGIYWSKASLPGFKLLHFHAILSKNLSKIDWRPPPPPLGSWHPLGNPGSATVCYYSATTTWWSLTVDSWSHLSRTGLHTPLLFAHALPCWRCNWHIHIHWAAVLKQSPHRFLINRICYRPQTKFGARLCFYTCLSVILITGVCGRYPHTQRQTPTIDPETDTPDPEADTPQTQRQTPPAER